MSFQKLFEGEKSNFGKLSETIADILKLNQGQLGERCRIHRTEVNRILNGKKNLELETIIKVANGIPILTKYLFDYTNKFTLDLIARKRSLSNRTKEEKSLLGQRLIKLRKHRKLIQLDIDIEAGIWESDISRIENAISNAKHYSLFRLASVLEITCNS